mgnify:CR=1 FL=1
MIREGKFQIGKNGVTSGVIESLNLYLKTHNQIRVSILKSANRDKNKAIEMAELIKSKIAYKCYYRIIGFTIILKRLSKKAQQ